MRRQFWQRRGAGSSTAAAPPQSGAHALPSATPAPRTRSSHPPPRSPPHANPLLALLVSLGAASLRVALGVVRMERGSANGEGDLGAPAFRVPALRCAGPEPRAPKGRRASPSGTHQLTICRLTHAPPNKRPHFPNPPRPGEPETRLSPLTHPIPSPVTQSRKSSSSHARASLTLTAPDSLSRFPSHFRFSRRRLSRAHPTHVPLGTAQSQVHVATSAALRASGALVGAALSL